MGRGGFGSLGLTAGADDVKGIYCDPVGSSLPNRMLEGPAPASPSNLSALGPLPMSWSSPGNNVVTQVPIEKCTLSF